MTMRCFEKSFLVTYLVQSDRESVLDAKIPLNKNDSFSFVFLILPFKESFNETSCIWKTWVAYSEMVSSILNWVPVTPINVSKSYVHAFIIQYTPTMQVKRFHRNCRLIYSFSVIIITWDRKKKIKQSGCQQILVTK